MCTHRQLRQDTMLHDQRDADAACQVPAPATTIQRDARTPTTLTRSQLAERIAQGESLVLHRRKIYKLDRWLATHPGGELAILHFVGRDATDEIEAYHSDDTVARLMSRFVIGYLDHADWDHYKPLVPPVQLGYRKGKLDHPHAQVAMWRHKNTPLPQALGVRAWSQSASPTLPIKQPSNISCSKVLLIQGMVARRVHHTRRPRTLRLAQPRHQPSSSRDQPASPFLSISWNHLQIRKPSTLFASTPSPMRTSGCINESRTLVSTICVRQATLEKWRATSF